MNTFRVDDRCVFSTVVETRSFSRAAELRDMSRAKVRHRIDELERRLAVRLPHRTTRRLGLTEAGELFYRYCVNVSQAVAEAESSRKEIACKAAGILKVAMPIRFGEEICLIYRNLPPKVRVFLDFPTQKPRQGGWHHA